MGWFETHAAPGETFPAVPAVGDGIRLVPTVRMYGAAPVGIGGGVPPFSVGPQGHEDVEEILALRREEIVMARRMLLILAGGHGPCCDESLETVGEGVAGDPETFDELVESTETEECISQDEHGPGVADDFDSVGDGALEVGEGLAAHAVILGE